MKKILVIGLMTLTAQSFASTYVGSNKGAACTLGLDLVKNTASLVSGTVGFNVTAKNKDIKNGLIIKMEGGDAKTDARITVTLNPAGDPLMATLEEKAVAAPAYQIALSCTNFVKTKN